jgi:hypothetical protein
MSHLIFSGIQLKLGHDFLLLSLLFIICFCTCWNAYPILLKQMPKNGTMLPALIDFGQNPIYAVFSLNAKELIFGCARYKNKSVVCELTFLYRKII